MRVYSSFPFSEYLRLLMKVRDINKQSGPLLDEYPFISRDTGKIVCIYIEPCLKRLVTLTACHDVYMLVESVIGAQCSHSRSFLTVIRLRGLRCAVARLADSIVCM